MNAREDVLKIVVGGQGKRLQDRAPQLVILGIVAHLHKTVGIYPGIGRYWCGEQLLAHWVLHRTNGGIDFIYARIKMLVYLISQNISKWTLHAGEISICFTLSIPYLFFVYL